MELVPRRFYRLLYLAFDLDRSPAETRVPYRGRRCPCSSSSRGYESKELSKRNIRIPATRGSCRRGPTIFRRERWKVGLDAGPQRDYYETGERIAPWTLKLRAQIGLA